MNEEESYTYKTVKKTIERLDEMRKEIDTIKNNLLCVIHDYKAEKIE